MSLRIVVDMDLCQGHGVCESEAPEVFAVGKDNKVHVLVSSPSEDQLNQVRMAIKYCPTHSLSLVEDSETTSDTPTTD